MDAEHQRDVITIVSAQYAPIMDAEYRWIRRCRSFDDFLLMFKMALESFPCSSCGGAIRVLECEGDRKSVV